MAKVTRATSRGSRKITVSAGHEDLVASAVFAKMTQRKYGTDDLSDPVRFSTNVLHHNVWDIPAEILESVQNNPKTAVKACHASSKTFTAAEAALWWLTAYPDGKVVTTAPTWVQVKNLLWGEIHKAIAKSEYPYPRASQTELRMGPDNFALGFSTDAADRFQGWHGRVLIIFDEAAGVRPALYEAVEGIRAGGQVHFLIIGNPTLAAGPFFDAFTLNRESWKTFTIDALETPNLRGIPFEYLINLKPDDPFLDDNKLPYLVTRRWVYERYYEWGEDSPMWQARVRGQFPLQDVHSLLPLLWLEQARYQDLVGMGNEWVAGVDVAGPGEDETVVLVRNGGDIVEMQAWTDPDPRQRVLRVLQKYNKPNNKLLVNVDSIGIGYYFAMYLQDNGLDVQPVNVNNSSYVIDPNTGLKKFVRLRDELFWTLREWLAAGMINGLTDDRLYSQLSTIKYHQDTKNQIKVQSKEEMIKKGARSPDEAEALMLSMKKRQKKGLVGRVHTAGMRDMVVVQRSNPMRRVAPVPR